MAFEQRQFVMADATGSSMGRGSWVLTGLGAITNTSGKNLWDTLVDWFQTGRGEIKVAATASANDFVQTMYGTFQPGIPIELNGRRFSERSIAGMIERCWLGVATSALRNLSTQMLKLAESNSGFKTWMEEHGNGDLEHLQGKIDEFRPRCDPSMFDYIPQAFRTGGIPGVPTTPGNPILDAGDNTMLWLLGGGIGALGLIFAMSGGKRKR